MGAANDGVPAILKEEFLNRTAVEQVRPLQHWFCRHKYFANLSRVENTYDCYAVFLWPNRGQEALAGLITELNPDRVGSA